MGRTLFLTLLVVALVAAPVETISVVSATCFALGAVGVSVNDKYRAT